jgi:hypothetical protein
MPTWTTRRVRRTGLDDPKSLVDSVGQRLFDIDLLAGFYGVDDHARVPVVRGCHNHGIDAFVVEELAVIAERFGPLRRVFETCLKIRFVDIAHRADFRARFLELPDQIATAPSRANDARADAVVGAEDTRLRRGRGQEKRPSSHGK